MILVSLVLACIDTSLGPIVEAPGVDDTGLPAQDDGVPLPSAQESACPLFRFSWRSPLPGTLHIEGELQGLDGGLPVPWQTWTDPVEGGEVVLEVEVCDAAAMRGEGVADLDNDGQADAWSCTRQADGSFALTGEVEFHLDGVPLPVHLAADPSSDGCGVLALFSEV